MIIKKSNRTPTKLMATACMRFAKNLGLNIIEKDDKFTIKEAYTEDDVYWISCTDIDISMFEEFIRMCISYASDKTHRVPTGSIMFHIRCPNCYTCKMTPKQYMLNVIEWEHASVVVCNNCGEIIRLNEKIRISD